MIHYVRRSANQHFGSTIKMKFNVTQIEFDFTDSQGSITFEDEIEARDLALGVWDADDEDDLIEEITSASGWCIQNIDYEIQLK